jgi:hypothetical protein
MERSTKAKKALDIQVLGTMRDCGHFDHLNARFLSDVAEVMQESDLEALKPYKFLRSSIDHKLAADFVMKFLEEHHMDFTLKCIEAEGGGELARAEPKDQRRLGLPPGDCFWELVFEWISGANGAIDENREIMRQALQRRIDSLTPVGRSSPTH